MANAAESKMNTERCLMRDSREALTSGTLHRQTGHKQEQVELGIELKRTSIKYVKNAEQQALGAIRARNAGIKGATLRGLTR